MKSKFNQILLILLYIDVHQKQDLLPVQVQPSVHMPTNCTCTPSYPKWHTKQWASMHELDICDGALVWLAAPSNQITEETLYLLSILTISGSAVLGDYELIQPFGFDADNYQQQSTIATWEVVLTIRRYMYMSYVLQLSTHISLDFIMFLRYLVVNNHIPEPSIQKKIANYLITVFGQTQAHYLQQLPKMMSQWGKVCIRNGGDCIHAAITQCDNSKNCEASFVWVCYQFLFIYFLLKFPITVWNTCWYNACHLNAPKWLEQRIFYGWLDYVLHCILPENCTPNNH